MPNLKPRNKQQPIPLVEAARIRGIPARTLRGAVSRGRLPAERMGRDHFVTLADVDAYLASRWNIDKKQGRKVAHR